LTNPKDSNQSAWHSWLPSRGNVLFTVFFTITILGSLFWAQSVGAIPLPYSNQTEMAAPESLGDSKDTISYQGYLQGSGGSPVNDSLDMVFRLYNQESGGTHLWSETHYAVTVSDGLFSVMLGSQEVLTKTIFGANPNLWLGVTIGSDNEMTPREKFTSVPYSMAGALPTGIITMWSGSIVSIPDGWSLCDGSNGTPDLRDSFVVGAGAYYTIGEVGGVISTTLTIDQLPAHSHSASASTDGQHTHSYATHTHSGSDRGIYSDSGRPYYSTGTTTPSGSHTHTITVDETGGGQSHDNRPPFYSLAFICKD